MFAKCIRQNVLISILPSDLLICLEGKTLNDQHISAFYLHRSATQRISILPLTSIHPSFHGLSAHRCQYPLTSTLGEFLGYRDWLWYPGLSPVLVSITLPLPYLGVFYSLFFPCHWISFVYFLRWWYLHHTTNPPPYSTLGTGTMVIG